MNYNEILRGGVLQDIIFQTMDEFEGFDILR